MAAPLRVATVGTGYFSRFHYDAWGRMPDVAVVGICSLDPAAATALAAGLARDMAAPDGSTGAGVAPALFSDVATMLDAVQPDLLDIITPPATHLPMLRVAAARGVPVICQKPMAPTPAAAAEMVDVAAAAGIPLVIHENFRWMPWFRHARTMIDAGRLGALHSVAFRLRPGDGQGPEAYQARQPYFRQMPRFLVVETGIHFIDSFRFLMGEVVAVTARLRRINPAIAGEDAGYILFEFATGATGLLDANRLNEHDADDCRLTLGDMHLEGSGGVLRLDGRARLFWKPHGAPEQPEPYDWQRRGFAGDCVYHQLRHMVAHLRNGTAAVNDGRAYLRNIAIQEAVYRSAAEGRTITLDPA